jgi:hypothetical protein
MAECPDCHVADGPCDQCGSVGKLVGTLVSYGELALCRADYIALKERWAREQAEKDWRRLTRKR